MAKRRDKGDGSVYELADGAGWRGYLDLGWEGGKRRRKYFSGATKREVLDKLNAARRAHEGGQPVPTSERQTVGDYLERWLADVVLPNKKPTTSASYDYQTRRHIIPELGRIRLTKLGAQDVQRWLNRKAESGLAPRNASRHFKLRLAKAGLRDQRLHDMRHACASLLLALGVPMHVVSAILGHSRISITVDTYGHVSPDLHRDAARRLGDALTGQG